MQAGLGLCLTCPSSPESMQQVCRKQAAPALGLAAVGKAVQGARQPITRRGLGLGLCGLPLPAHIPAEPDHRLGLMQGSSRLSGTAAEVLLRQQGAQVTVLGLLWMGWRGCGHGGCGGGRGGGLQGGRARARQQAIRQKGDAWGCRAACFGAHAGPCKSIDYSMITS